MICSRSCLKNFSVSILTLQYTICLWRSSVILQMNTIKSSKWWWRIFVTVYTGRNLYQTHTDLSIIDIKEWIFLKHFLIKDAQNDIHNKTWQKFSIWNFKKNNDFTILGLKGVRERNLIKNFMMKVNEVLTHNVL